MLIFRYKKGENNMYLRGKYNEAIIYQDIVELEAQEQLQNLLDQPFVENERIRVMPDVHAGAGCTIGFTQTINNGKVCPNLVGVDIACGVRVVNLGKVDITYAELDSFIRENIPAGKNINEEAVVDINLEELRCYKSLKNIERISNSLKSLGGGNHFIEVDEDEEGNKYILIHTGSRNLGKQVAEYYQDLADKNLNDSSDDFSKELSEMIVYLKSVGRAFEIQEAKEALKLKYTSKKPNVPKDLAYLEGDSLKDYLHDVDICQKYAILNRTLIANAIVNFLGCNVVEEFETMHNYIDLEGAILRKGSVDASLGKKLVIPISMKEGALICVGKGNVEYNFSAPHGAGRIMSRARARKELSLEDFKNIMEGIFTTSVSSETIDEAPNAYKSLEMILPYIEDTVEVVNRIKPVYNFKAGE